MSLLRVGLSDDLITLADASASEAFTYVPSRRTCAYGGRTVALDDVPAQAERRGDVDRDRRDVGRALGSVRLGLKHVLVRPGGLSSAPHCHSHEEEAFVVLAGAGSLELYDRSDMVAQHPLTVGQALLRPPGTGVAHAFRAGGDGLTLLALGTRDPGDMCFYPRSQKVFLRGLGVVFRVDRVDFWDGEPS